MNTRMIREGLVIHMSRVRAGAEPTIRLAVSSEMAGVTDRYFD